MHEVQLIGPQAIKMTGADTLPHAGKVVLLGLGLND